MANLDASELLEREVAAALDAISPLHAIHPEWRATAPSRRVPVGGAVKRVFDVVVSAAALALLAIPLALVAVAIKLDSKGPVFFLQRRGGFKGRPFLVIKFRTMTTADDGNAIAQAAKTDARITRVGAFLRKTSIDELPQLINVLKGEMSLVGPRPHAVAHDGAFRSVDRRYGRRFKARPGVTGLAQVRGSRGLIRDDADVRRRVELDLNYIDNWSLDLDLWIIARTAIVILRDPNAH
jgi:lipopolysaccharide/colanic/teichoic acid biosynthesis glycosyltransferase